LSLLDRPEGIMTATLLFHPLHSDLDEAPSYSQVVEAAGWLFVAGQVPNDPPNHRTALPADIEGQTRLAMDNLRAALDTAGADLASLVSVRIFLTDFATEFERMNTVYRSYFDSGRLPARTCVGVVALAHGARIEIDGIARRG
jgi:2-iminobutanoate/2-iminopropanoate deaminase